MAKTNLKALSGDELEQFVNDLGLPSYRAGQLRQWIYSRGVSDISEITVLSKELRGRLSDIAYISSLRLIERRASKDGTEKFLFGLEDGESIESVLIPDEDRLTLCVSSQVGCAMSCAFCLTGTLGFKRNLKAHEIVDQFLQSRILAVPGRITNIVFMGMGEPLNNIDEVSEAIERITEYAGLSMKRITVSTVGIAPKIGELAGKVPHVNLAVSLNATLDSVRDEIMPVNRRYPLKELFAALRKYPLSPRQKITFEYVMLKGVNDSPGDAGRLVGLLKGIQSKVNLIPFNEFEGSNYRRPDEADVLAFQKVLVDSGLTALIRKSKGADILAACGQLKAGYSL